ncbi:hypothetical protein C8J55DRAFT_490761 [Lentinula edodes]|uniref:Uncharacterized protein n=1 Tax=Lentinula lateritia TaxID=40482 RepID=A0A9W9DJZ6_9AGAR|nr:hypothetical protein C8J55DRAFT_490761 [Lentinula edodes]
MTDLKFHFSFNKDGTTKYVQLPPVAHCVAEVDQQSHSLICVAIKFGICATDILQSVSPEDQNRDAGEYHSNMNVPPPSLNAQAQRYNLPDFPNCSMPLPAVSNSTQVEGLTCNDVPMSPHIQQSEQAELTGCSTVQDKDLCSGSSDYLLLGVHHKHVPTSSTSLPAPTTDNSHSADHASTASPRDPNPNAESGSVWTGIKIFAQDPKAPKENHLRVGIHGGKPSSTIVFVQKKVNHKDAWTRSFILKAALVDHPPDFELPRGSGLLCPNDLFYCIIEEWSIALV